MLVLVAQLRMLLGLNNGVDHDEYLVADRRACREASQVRTAKTHLQTNDAQIVSQKRRTDGFDDARAIDAALQKLQYLIDGDLSLFVERELNGLADAAQGSEAITS